MMAGKMPKIGAVFQGICGFCLRPTAKMGTFSGSSFAAVRKQMLQCQTRMQGQMVKYVATLTNTANQSQHQETTSDEKPNCLIPDSSKRETLVKKVKEAMSKSLDYGRIFAVVHIGGKQFKITPHDIIMINKITARCGDKIKLQKVLMVGGKEFSLIGKPLLSGVHIEATVLEKTKGRNVIVFKKKRRKNYKRWKEYRSDVTVLRINKVSMKPDSFDM